MDKFLNHKHFKTVETEDKNNLTKELDKDFKNNINKNIIIKKDNNKNYFDLKSLELNDNYLNFNSTFNSKINNNYTQNEHNEDITQKKGEYFKGIKNKDNKENKFIKTNIKENSNNTYILPKDTSISYLKKSKIINTAINIPKLNITNKINFNESYKKIIKKRKINLNIYEINENKKNINNTNRTIENQSDEKRKIINTQRNNSSSYKKIIINILKKQQNFNSNISKKGKEKFLKNETLKNTKKTCYTEREKYFMDTSSNKEIKLNKTSIIKLIDNYHLKTQNSILNKNKYNNNTTINNKIKNNFYFNTKIPLEQNDIFKSNGNNTNRISTKRL